MKTEEIATRIRAHLQRFENDPDINKPIDGLRRFDGARAYASGGWVHVTYVSYQGSACMRKADAAKYLEKLDAGFVGRHWTALREALTR